MHTYSKAKHCFDQHIHLLMDIFVQQNILKGTLSNLVFALCWLCDPVHVK